VMDANSSKLTSRFVFLREISSPDQKLSENQIIITNEPVEKV